MICLASGSPRRRMLLESAGFQLTVRAPNVDESRRPEETPEDTALRLAHDKAHHAGTSHVVLGADTIVHLDGQIFDKPTDRDMARSHLMALSGRWHMVTTGVCIRQDQRFEHLCVTTRVRFRHLSSKEIERYLVTGEADDKAGA